MAPLQPSHQRRLSTPAARLVLGGATLLSAQLVLATDAHAAVGIEGSGLGCNHPTISSALAAATPGAVILVEPGVHVESLLSMTSPVTVTSGDASCSVPGSGAILDGGGAQIALVTADVVFADIELQNGSSLYGGLLDVRAGSLVLDSVVLHDGVSTGDGGCIHVENASVEITGASHISHCDADDDGGVIEGSDATIEIHGQSVLELSTAGDDGGAIALERGWLWIGEQAVVRDNAADYLGGGVCSIDADVTIDGQAAIEANYAEFYGGGLTIRQNPGELVTLELNDDVRVVDNLTGELGYGGGIYLEDLDLDYGASLDAWFRDRVLIANNEALGGGGIFAYGASLTFTDAVDVYDNSARSAIGGGLWHYHGQASLTGTSFRKNYAGGIGGAGIFATHTDVSLTNTYFASNLTPGDGGALLLEDDSSLYVDQDPELCDPMALPADEYCTWFYANIAGGQGGGVYLDASNLVAQRSAWTSNYAFDGFAIYSEAAAPVSASNLLVADNIGPDASAALHAEGFMYLGYATIAGNDGEALRHGPGASGGLSDSIVWANVDGAFLAPGTTANDNVVQSLVGGGGSGNLWTDPLFVTTARGDYRLLAVSPALDSAGTTSWSDLDGVARPLGAGNDRGTFECF